MKIAPTYRYGLILSALLLADIGGAATASAAPWRLGQAVGLPDWLSVDGSYRLRYQALDNPYRAGDGKSDNLLDERLLLNAKADFGNGFYIDAELEDARTQLDDATTPLGTDDVNAFELLRGFVGYKGKGVFAAGDSLDVQAGRITMDVGSRRFVARNDFRNTINAFTGVNGVWTGADGLRVQAFFTSPVDREPTALDALDHNHVEFDKESFKNRFWGLDLSRQNIFGNLNGEVYVFGLHEGDRHAVQTKNRRLYTPGARLYTKPAPGAWDYEVEGDLQFGKTRASTAVADTNDLDVFAGFVHVSVARTLQAAWSPRVVFQYDYASGDSDPGDDDSNQFDTLFGARRSEFGPTGIYGALARSNISSPGVRIEAKPSAVLNGFIGYRAAWLASDQDGLTTSGLRDTTGHSGSFIGHQLEARVRYDLIPGNVGLDIGGAYLIKGNFLKHVPGAPDAGDTTYVYAATTLTF